MFATKQCCSPVVVESKCLAVCGRTFVVSSAFVRHQGGLVLVFLVEAEAALGCVNC